MSTTQEKLNYLLKTKAEIEQAIFEKGVTIESGVPFRSYVNKIQEITTGKEVFPVYASGNLNPITIKRGNNYNYAFSIEYILDDYVLMLEPNATTAGNQNIMLYKFDAEKNNYEFICNVAAKSSSNYKFVIAGYNEEKVYVLNFDSTKTSTTVYTVDLAKKTAGIITASGLGNTIASAIKTHVSAGNGNMFITYISKTVTPRFAVHNPSTNRVQYTSITPYVNTQIGKDIFVSVGTGTTNIVKIDINNISYKSSNADNWKDTFYGINYKQDKCFTSDGIYEFNNISLQQGVKIADYNLELPITDVIYCLNDRYYLISNTIYEFNEETNEFEEIYQVGTDVDLYNTVPFWNDNILMKYTTSDKEIGFILDGMKYFFPTNAVSGISSDKVLIGYNTYSKDYTAVSGTMPNLGSINIEPKTTTQQLSTGYILGGVVNPVTSAIDENILPENIKSGIEILGVTGTAEVRGEENAVVTTNISSSSQTVGGGLLKCITHINTTLKSTGTSCAYMFYKCESLKYIKAIDTTNVANMQYMFNYCAALEEVPMLDTSKVTTMTAMFAACNKLKSVPLFDTSKVTDMQSMFNGCEALEEVPALDTSNVTSFYFFCGNCRGALKTVPLLDLGKATNISYIFEACSKLENLGGLKDLGKAYTKTTTNNSAYELKLSASTNLTHESLMNVINNLYDLNLSYDVANGGTLYRQKLNIGSTNIAKLTEEEIAIATNKGWNVV